jgi:hypothetical protein
MTSDGIAVIAFIALCFGLIYMDSSREVSVHLCESDGVSTYVSVNAPPQELSFGECHEEVMVNERYHHLRQVMKRGSK